MHWKSCGWMIILILFQLTGRVEPKRRWSDGIHQAVEAKEGLKIQVVIDLQIATLHLWSYYFYNLLKVYDSFWCAMLIAI